MKANGMAELGYNYITLDDCFAMRRNSSTNELFPDPERFPVGFSRIVQLAHDLGKATWLHSRGCMRASF